MYVVETFDPISEDIKDGCEWRLRAILPRWLLRPALRALEDQSYTRDMSIYVTRLDIHPTKAQDIETSRELDHAQPC